MDKMKKTNNKYSFKKFILIFNAFYFLTFFIYGSKRGMTHLSNITYLIFIAFSFIYLIKDNKLSNLKIHKIYIFPTIFIIILLIGLIRSYNQTFNYYVVKSYLNLFLYSILLFNLVEDKNDFELTIKSINFAIFIFSVYVISVYGLSNFIDKIINSRRIGYLISQPNTVGHYASIGFLFSFYFLISNKSYKFLYFLTSLTNFVIVISTLSRKALLISIIGAISLIFYYNYHKNKNNLFKSILKLMFLVSITYLIINNLFILIGQKNDRISSLFSLLLSSNNNINSSDLVRKELISNGWSLFKTNPIFGYGGSNFRSLGDSSLNTFVASHNNFIEILVSYGLIGFVIYYLPYLIISTKLLKKSLKKFSILDFLILILIITDVFISGMTMITFVNEISSLVLSISIIYLYKIKGDYYEK